MGYVVNYLGSVEGIFPAGCYYDTTKLQAYRTWTVKEEFCMGWVVRYALVT